MDKVTTCITFPYTIVSYEIDQNILKSTQEALDTLVETINQKHPTVAVNIIFNSNNFDSNNHIMEYAISLSGQSRDVLIAKQSFLDLHLTRKSTSIKTLKPLIERISQTSTLTQIFDFSKIIYKPEKNELEIIDKTQLLETFKIKILVMLDQYFGLSVASVPCQKSIQPIVAGLKRENINALMLEYSVTIYLSEDEDLINITGKNVEKAKTKLLELIEKTTPQIISKNITCLPRKLDWIVTHSRNYYKKIEVDNAVYITLPLLGSNQNIVTMSGTKVEYVERAIRAFMRLCSDIYVASIQTMNIADNPTSFMQLLENIRDKVGIIASTNNVECLFTRNIIDLYGIKNDTMKAYQDITSLDVIKSGIRDTKFQIELALEHREFINGKKNGKMNKIIKTSSCRIAFQETLNEYNMLIDVYCPVPSRLSLGVQLLEDELPAETSFYIPESFHKRIIGVGGKNIQKIMKKFGVYVKFSNAEEFALLGGYYENRDNVIARTPAKNKENLQDLRVTIIESVNATELLDETAEIEIPHQLWPFVFGEKGANIERIRDEFQVQTIFGDREQGLDSITLQGPVGNVSKAKAVLMNSVPQVLALGIPASPQFNDLVNSQEWKFPVLIHYDQEISIYIISVNNAEKIKQEILDLLSNKRIPVTPLPRSTSAQASGYSSFQGFNSKLLVSERSLDQKYIFENSSVGNLRDLFDDSAAPPGLKRSGSDIRANVIARPGSITSDFKPQFPKILNEGGDFLRHPHTRMGQLAVGSTKSSSMTSLIPNTAFGERQTGADRWNGSSFVKSLSSASMVPEKPKPVSRGSSSFMALEPDTEEDQEIDQKMMDQVISLAIDQNDSTDIDKIAKILESIGHEKYLNLFIEHEIDFATFLSLEDADLKELGIKALGSRKKILVVIKQCKEGNLHS